MDTMRVEDNARISMSRGRASEDLAGIVGYGSVELHDETGLLKVCHKFKNLITDVGDLYAATAVIRTPAGAGAPSPAPVGMKLGTGTTAAAKSGAGGGIVTYISGSAAAFGSVTTNNLGAGLGVEARFVQVWGAGTATNSAITEAAICSNSTNATSLAAEVFARIVFAAIDKQAGDSLTITWNWKYLGA